MRFVSINSSVVRIQTICFALNLQIVNYERICKNDREEDIINHNNVLRHTLKNLWLGTLLVEICEVKGFNLIDTIKHGTDEEFLQIVKENFDDV